MTTPIDNHSAEVKVRRCSVWPHAMSSCASAARKWCSAVATTIRGEMGADRMQDV